jgi:uncharacterized protein (DUF4415 family)
MVTYHLDLENPPPLTPEQHAMLDAAAKLGEEQIDFSDIPELTEEFFARVERGPYRPRKAQTTLRLDIDVLEWFKRHAENGKGYQTDINRALREYIAAREKAG